MISTTEKIAEIQKQRNKLCREYSFDPKKAEFACSQISPLIRKILVEKKLFSMIEELTDDLKRSLEYSIEVTSISGTPKQKSLLRLFGYLEMSEGVFSELVQSLAFFLMQNGHDIYDPQRMKFIKEYKELDKIPLFVKLQFIEEHELKFVSDAFDRELRNCIAHLDYIVKDDGDIINKRTGRKIEDLDGKILNLNAMIQIMLTIYNEIIIKLTEEVDVAKMQERKNKSNKD